MGVIGALWESTGVSMRGGGYSERFQGISKRFRGLQQSLREVVGVLRAVKVSRRSIAYQCIPDDFGVEHLSLIEGYEGPSGVF